MKKVFQKKHISLVGIAIVGISLGFIVQFVRAWTEPAAAPPGGNIGAPLNTGTQAQTKKGPISIQGYGWNATVPGNSSSPRCACDIGGGQECGAVGSVFTANPTGGNLGDICYDWFSVRVGSSTIPFSAKYVVGSNIRLDNNGVTFANGAYVSGSGIKLASGGGIKFADGTTQTTAPAAQAAPPTVACDWNGWKPAAPANSFANDSGCGGISTGFGSVLSCDFAGAALRSFCSAGKVTSMSSVVWYVVSNNSGGNGGM